MEEEVVAFGWLVALNFPVDLEEKVLDGFAGIFCLAFFCVTELFVFVDGVTVANAGEIIEFKNAIKTVSAINRCKRQ